MAVSFIGGENRRPAPSHWQTLSHNVVSSTPRLSEVRTHNVSGNRHWLHSSTSVRSRPRRLPLDGRLAGYNTESLAVDNNWVTCFGECHTLHAKEIFFRFRKRVGAFYCCCYKILFFRPDPTLHTFSVGVNSILELSQQCVFFFILLRICINEMLKIRAGRSH